MELVRVWDPDSGTITEIPVGELAPGMMRVRVEGIEGEVFVSEDAIKVDQGRELQELDEEQLRMLSVLWDSVEEVWRSDYQDWLTGFRRDRNPDREIVSWVKIVAGYNFFTRGSGYEKQQKRAVLDLLCLFSINGPSVVETVPSEMRPTVQSMVDALMAGKAQGELEALLEAAGWS